MMDNRINNHPVLSVDEKSDFITFNFNGKKITAKSGEMISSALFANGIHVFGHHHKDNSPQGIYCANGQCSQCLVLANGIPVKSCIVPVEENMDVRSLEGLPELLKDDEIVKKGMKTPIINTRVLIIGGGPAGLSAAIELGLMEVKCIICDDKQDLGGKLSLQTHNFFGSIRDCFAGSRGMDIGYNLTSKVKKDENLDIWTDSPVVGVFVDGLIGIVKNGRYVLVKPDIILITTGAREKTLAFPGCDLPGVYGAGAFQTLVNRDLIKPTEKLFIIGGGNVGIIAAYHALQAGIEVIGLVEALPECGGYKVHLDKVKRMGIPIYTSHTVLKAIGINHLEKVVITRIDDKFKPIKGTEKIFEADTLLIAVGLSPVDELKKQAEVFGLKTYAAGDADIIAEASAAMFSGKIIARKILIDMGFNVEIPPEWNKMVEILRSRPGPIKKTNPSIPKDTEIYTVMHCFQEIPCNPCTETCVLQSIKIKDKSIMGTPSFEGKCLGCGRCVSLCPGLAITLVDKKYDYSKKTARIMIPWEMPKNSIKVNQIVSTTNIDGNIIGEGKVIAIKTSEWQNKRQLVSIEIPYKDTDKVVNIRIKKAVIENIPKSDEILDDNNIIICRCERVTKKEIVDYIKNTGTKDFNAVKAALRVGMGACGGKTCTELIMRIFRELGVDLKDVEANVERPFSQEIPIYSFLNDGDFK
ncbi:2Fe-2S iron-sulfur cluster-binding protein [Thermoplasmatota archaeon]